MRLSEGNGASATDLMLASRAVLHMPRGTPASDPAGPSRLLPVTSPAAIGRILGANMQAVSRKITTITPHRIPALPDCTTVVTSASTQL